jgi:hypothetical protein
LGWLPRERLELLFKLLSSVRGFVTLSSARTGTIGFAVRKDLLRRYVGVAKRPLRGERGGLPVPGAVKSVTDISCLLD